MIESCQVTRLSESDEYKKCVSAKNLGGNCGTCKSSRIDVVASREESRAVTLCKIKRNKRVNALSVCGHFEKK